MVIVLLISFIWLILPLSMREFGDKCVMVCIQAQVWHNYVGGDTPIIDMVKQLMDEKN